MPYHHFLHRPNKPHKPPTSSHTKRKAMLFKILKMFVAGVATLVPLLGVLLYTFQLKIVYPARLVDGGLKTERPDKYDMPYEEAYIGTPDGEKLHTYILTHDKYAPGFTNKTVVVLNPNAGNIGHALPIVELFYKQMRHNVIIYSYRGYGESTGTANEVGLKIDADAVMKYISEHPKLSKTSLILYGRSLGGAVAIYIASKNYVQVKGVILENTFLSIRHCIPHVFPLLRHFQFLCHQIWDSEHDILKISPDVPMLFMCATNDEIVPPSNMERLFKLAPTTRKKRCVFEGYHHNDTCMAPNYWNTVGEFIGKL